MNVRTERLEKCNRPQAIEGHYFTGDALRLFIWLLTPFFSSNADAIGTLMDFLDKELPNLHKVKLTKPLRKQKKRSSRHIPCWALELKIP
jgi:hypothetical protein